jgi:transposase
MNLQIHHVLSEVTGVSGLAILDAILSRERDPMKFASLCNWRVRSPREVVAKALVGITDLSTFSHFGSRSVACITS